MTRFGRKAVEAIWVEREYETMKRLWRAGASVPIPVMKTGNTILMTYIGDIEHPAPKLAEMQMDQTLAQDIYIQVFDNLKILLDLHLVHGDLSPYNILYWNDQVWIIDFPQTVDIYRNPNAVDLFYRDLVNICNFLKRRGVDCSPSNTFYELLGIKYREGSTFDELNNNFN